MDIEVIVFGALTRMVQALVAASPTIFVGWLVAAIFERILGREGTYRLFGGNTWRQLPQAWLLGMLLPVCSLGVIPVMHQMRKSGISGGTILAFGLTAPLFNPISVLYGLTLSDPLAILAFSLCSLLLITILGLLWDRLFPNSQQPLEALEKTPYGLRRIAAVALSMAHQAWSRSSLYMFLAILGVGILAGLLPAGVLQRAAGKDDTLAPLTMSAVATLAYITPMTAIVQVASMFQHGNSVAAAFALLTLGTGVNLGLLVWMVRHYGFGRSLVWLGCLVGIVLVMSYSLDRPLRPKGIEPADHTHAFDTYCNPFVSGEQDYWASSKRVLQEAATPAGYRLARLGDRRGGLRWFGGIEPAGLFPLLSTGWRDSQRDAQHRGRDVHGLSKRPMGQVGVLDSDPGGLGTQDEGKCVSSWSTFGPLYRLEIASLQDQVGTARACHL